MSSLSTVQNKTGANDLEASHNDLPGTSMTLRQMFIIVGGVAALVTLINCLITLVTHFIWRTNFREQKQ